MKEDIHAPQPEVKSSGNCDTTELKSTRSEEDRMPPIAVVTDSAASIPDELLKSLPIHWVPYYIHRGDEVLRDLLTIQRDAFYAWMPGARELPKTASPGPGDYIMAYESLAAQGVQEIISIHMTSKGSGAYQAAIAAKGMMQERLPNIRIEVVDTLNVAMCQGWIAIEAARAIQCGQKLSEIMEMIQRMILVTRMVQTADSLKYLLMGGRIGRAVHLIGSLMNIKPIISMENGEIVALGTASSRRGAYRRIAALVESSVGRGRKIKIAYMHTAAREEAEKLRELIEPRLTCVETLFAELSPALGVHSGPGTVGVCYFPITE
jgi:DegV family protein with EDD domain